MYFAVTRQTVSIQRRGGATDVRRTFLCALENSSGKPHRMRDQQRDSCLRRRRAEPGRLNDRPEVFARALSAASNIEEQAPFVVDRTKHSVEQALLRPIDQTAATR